MKPKSCIQAGGSLHCKALTGVTGPSTVLTSPAWGGEAVQERLNVPTSAHTIGVSLLNTLAFCLAVNNSCPWAVGGTCFRQEERMPMSKSLNIHRLLFAGTMCGSNCKLKWSCVHWHLWIQNYHCGYLWDGGGEGLQKEKTSFLHLILFFLNWNTWHFCGSIVSPLGKRVTGIWITY